MIKQKKLFEEKWVIQVKSPLTESGWMISMLNNAEADGKGGINFKTFDSEEQAMHQLCRILKNHRVEDDIAKYRVVWVLE